MRNEIESYQNLGINKSEHCLVKNNFGCRRIWVSGLKPVFSFKERKVIAHMPHMINRKIMADLQSTFPDEFRKTSSNRYGGDLKF